ncbi:MAG: 3'-5' exonuclease [Rhodothermaceae bacterium]|nr:3'-5' exonuclease [Rhodothermaceae bacterium]
MPASDCFVSVDVETSGPSPSRHALLSIGACLVESPDDGFYAELKPGDAERLPEAMAVSGLDAVRLEREGLAPAAAFAAFAAWLDAVVPKQARPVFVGFNACFDWLWICDGFHRHLGRNPFGHAALDIKALYMGRTGSAWSETGFTAVAAHVGLLIDALPHHALDDARLQARVFRALLDKPI